MVRADRHSAHLGLKVQRNKLFCMEYFSTYSIFLLSTIFLLFLYFSHISFSFFPVGKQQKKFLCLFSHLASIIA